MLSSSLDKFGKECGETTTTTTTTTNLLNDSNYTSFSKVLNQVINSKSDYESIGSPESNDSGIQSDEQQQQQLNNQRLSTDINLLYSTVNKKHNKKSNTTTTTTNDNIINNHYMSKIDELDLDSISNPNNTNSNSNKDNDLSISNNSEFNDNDACDDIIHVEQNELPLGWIRCCDDDGIYYWHKPTGTVTRRPPPKKSSDYELKNRLTKNDEFLNGICKSKSFHMFNTDHYQQVQIQQQQLQQNPQQQQYLDVDYNEYHSDESDTGNENDSNDNDNENESTKDGSTNSSSSTTESLDQHTFQQQQQQQQQLQLLQQDQNMNLINQNLDDCNKNSTVNKRFYVRSLGWVKIQEYDLTQDRCSKAVNKCIYELSRGVKDYNDVVARWGHGKDLYLDIENDNLLLVDPIENKVLNKQPIESIRVWGVGRDNGRDFAYVARDNLSKIHMCHVFRCEGVPAKEIANCLKDICKRIMFEKKSKTKPTNRPNLLADLKRIDVAGVDNSSSSFPTHIDEPRKSINCKYIGSMNVDKPAGMEVLNSAIDKLYKRSCKQYMDENLYDDLDEVADDEHNYDINNEIVVESVKSKWLNVEVTISPSTIYARVHNEDGSSNLLFECRVRYLSFMGISTNVKVCGLIIHCADNTFKCHAFYCEPSSGPLCKTIEAACKLRYQKCLDAHPEAAKYLENKQKQNSKGLGTQLKNMFDSLRNRRKR